MHNFWTAILIAVAWVVIGHLLGLFVWPPFGWMGWIGGIGVMIAHLFLRHKDIQ